MTDENVAQEPVATEPVQEALPDMKSALDILTAPTVKPAGKKRGPKPKTPPAPLPPPEPIKAVRKRKRGGTVRLSATDRAFQSAITSTENDRAKCIEEMSKIMEMWDVKQARLKALDWKLSTLRGTTQTSAIAGMQLSPYGAPQQQYPPNINYPPMPAAYLPTGQPGYVPPAMRQPAVPVDPRASGGSEGIIDDGQNGEEDQFLTGGGVIGSGKWVG